MSECDRSDLRARWGLKYVGLSHFTIRFLNTATADNYTISLVSYYTFYKN